jgi:hypothetical protein
LRVTQYRWEEGLDKWTCMLRGNGWNGIYRRHEVGLHVFYAKNKNIFVSIPMVQTACQYDLPFRRYTGCPTKCITILLSLVSNRFIVDEIWNFLKWKIVFISSKSVHPNRRHICFYEAKSGNTTSQVLNWKAMHRDLPTKSMSISRSAKICDKFLDNLDGIFSSESTWYLLLKKKVTAVVSILSQMSYIKFLELTWLSFTKAAVSLFWMDRFWWN